MISNKPADINAVWGIDRGIRVTIGNRSPPVRTRQTGNARRRVHVRDAPRRRGIGNGTGVVAHQATGVPVGTADDRARGSACIDVTRVAPDQTADAITGSRDARIGSGDRGDRPAVATGQQANIISTGDASLDIDIANGAGIVAEEAD